MPDPRRTPPPTSGRALWVAILGLRGVERIAVQCYDSLAFLRGVSSLHTEDSGTAPPDAFGPFRVLHQIGAGTLGPVFRAYEPEMDKLVAVKRFDLDLPPDQVHRFSAELDVLVQADLTHPAIAAPVATGISGVAAYLAQDFVSGEPLVRGGRDRGRVAPAEAIRIVRELASAFDFAATAGVYHGSFHPRDVLVSPDEVRLTGLGIAQSLDRIGVTPPVRRPFTAPEQVSGKTWNFRADLFALAVLAHELLWGKRLTATGDAAAIALVDLPGGDMVLLRAAFARGLAEDPGERFEDASAFAEELTVAFSESVTEGADRPLATGIWSGREVGCLPPGEDHVSGSEPEYSASIEPVVGQSPTLDELKAFAAEQYADDAQVEEPTDLGPSDLDDPSDAALFTPPSHDDEADVNGRRPGAESFRAAVFISPEEARSALWPVVLAAVMFTVLGFVAGNAVATLGGLTLFGGLSPEPTVQQAPSPRPSTPANPVQSTEPREPQPVVDTPVRLPPQASEPESDPSSVTPVRAAPTMSQAGTSEEPAVAEPGPPSLTIESRPPGAAVFVDGRQIGKTPMVTSAVNVGEHAIRLELDGYRAWTTSVGIVSGPNRVAASLQP